MRRAAFAIARAILTIERALLTVAMIALAAITIANVVARNLLDHNLAAAQELNEFLIVLICFVGLSYGASQGRHIRMTAVYDQLPPRWKKLMMVIISATTAALLFTLAFFAWRYAMSVDRSSPVLQVPLRYVYLAAPLGLAMGGVQYLLTLARNLTDQGVWISFSHPDEHLDAPPVGES